MSARPTAGGTRLKRGPRASGSQRSAEQILGTADGVVQQERPQSAVSERPSSRHGAAANRTAEQILGLMQKYDIAPADQLPRAAERGNGKSQGRVDVPLASRIMQGEARIRALDAALADANALDLEAKRKRKSLSNSALTSDSDNLTELVTSKSTKKLSERPVKNPPSVLSDPSEVLPELGSGAFITAMPPESITTSPKLGESDQDSSTTVMSTEDKQKLQQLLTQLDETPDENGDNSSFTTPFQPSTAAAAQLAKIDATLRELHTSYPSQTLP